MYSELNVAKVMPMHINGDMITVGNDTPIFVLPLHIQMYKYKYMSII